jgi:redox-sensitive bicupin YhaK (pirin superfamily)
MIAFRDRLARGHATHGWLESFHTFSFGSYHDPAQMGFRTLRVINEDRVIPGAGFPTHGHRDMEILSYVLEGALEHKDSLGTGSVIRAGDVQRMSAGTGVRHSEYNASKTEPVHFLQIWILPERAGAPPSYEQKSFPVGDRRNALILAAAPGGAEGVVALHQDARLHLARLDAGRSVAHGLAAGRGAWLQVARGLVALNGTEMREGDGAAVSDEPRLAIEALTDAEVLLFDLA